MIHLDRLPVDHSVPAGRSTAEQRRLREIHFPKNLLATIRRERARADRLRGQFSLVMFRLVPRRGRWGTLRLCRVVLTEVRSADEVGQFDRHTVCAILPDTPPHNAWKLIDRVTEQAAAKGMTVEAVVYAYPSNWFDSHSGDGSGSSSTAKSAAQTSSSAAANPAANRVTLPLESLTLVRPGLVKRGFDILVAGSVLTILSPAMLVIAALIKWTSDGPVIFKQWRSGLGGQPFEIYKFRTMCVDADAMKSALRAQSEQDGPAFKLTNDPRITRIGHFLRKTSLDELPQLINVLKGDMSIVGPRPLPLDEQAQCDQWHKRRLDVLPGLTCIWQVHGRSRVSFEEWMRMDLKYIRRYQVLHDLKLMLQTIPAVVLRRGAK